MQPDDSSERRSVRARLNRVARVLLFVLMLYLFLVAIELFSGSIKMAGHETADRLFRGLRNPFAGLAVGILATVLVQSSSVTTSTIVAMVGSGTLPLAHAVPMVMGANIGTSVTNTVVSLGHIGQGAAFRRAFAGATIHDIFNLLTVLILLPIELLTGVLQHSAEWLTARLPAWGGDGGAFKSPVKQAVKAASKLVVSFFEDTLGLTGGWLSLVLAALAFVLILTSLVFITKNMRVLLADRIEQWLNRVLRRSAMLGLVIGIAMTVLVQSSSITTSLLVPVFAAGVMKLEAGFPIMLGANIGTTVTALIASTVAGPAGLCIALVHLLFNLAGTAIFLPIRAMRRLPIWLAEALALAAQHNRIWVLLYIFGVFVAAPLLGIWLWQE